MKREILVYKTKLNEKAPKGRAWHAIKSVPLMAPDEMERIVNVLRMTAQIKVDWLIEPQRKVYEVFVLSYPPHGLPEVEEKRGRLEYACREWIEWLDPIIQKNVRHAELMGLRFEAYKS
jgi:hypothetical protein